MNSELASSSSLSRLKSSSASLHGGSSETSSHDGDNQTNDKETAGKFVEIYGEMISDSLKINNNSLIECLDDILRTLNNYFILLDKSDVEIKTYFEHVNPIIESKQSELAGIYDCLDRLEVIVNRLKLEYASLNDRLTLAEKEVNSRIATNTNLSLSASSSSLPTQQIDKFRKFIDSKLSSNKTNTLTSTPTPTSSTSDLQTASVDLSVTEASAASNELNNAPELPSTL